MVTQVLPKSRTVDVSALSRLFTERTTSYKFLFFYALINKIHTTDNSKIYLQDLANDMLALAWYPNKFFKLSFGSQDQIATILDRLIFSLDGKKVGSAGAEKDLQVALTEQCDEIGSKKLIRYVPYRLLTVFFESELRGKADQRKNSLIARLAKEFFDEKKPFYRISDSAGHAYLECHPSWRKYFIENFSILSGWFYLEWLNFLQTKNPNIPSISTKVLAPPIRSPLIDQKVFLLPVTSVEEDVNMATPTKLDDGLKSRFQQMTQIRQHSAQRIMKELLPDLTIFESEIEIVNKTTIIINALYEAGLKPPEFFKMLWDEGYKIPADWPLKSNGNPLSCNSKKTRRAIPAINRLISAWDMRIKREHDRKASIPVIDNGIADNNKKIPVDYRQEIIITSIQSQAEKEELIYDNASKFFVAGELCRRGYFAFVTSGNMPNTDILCSNLEGTKFVHIQVKTFIPGSGTCSVEMKIEYDYGDSLFWVLGGIPKLNQGKEFEYFIIPAEIMAKKNIKENRLWFKTSGEKKSLSRWDISEFQNRWDLIEKKLNKVG